jgi:hypothetical protein
VNKSNSSGPPILKKCTPAESQSRPLSLFTPTFPPPTPSPAGGEGSPYSVVGPFPAARVEDEAPPSSAPRLGIPLAWTRCRQASSTRRRLAYLGLDSFRAVVVAPNRRSTSAGGGGEIHPLRPRGAAELRRGSSSRRRWLWTRHRAQVRLLRAVPATTDPHWISSLGSLGVCNPPRKIPYYRLNQSTLVIRQ